jgi:hypothetical protein
VSKKSRRGGLWRWWRQKRRRKPGSETMQRQRLQTREAWGKEEGCGGRRRRISESRSSSSNADAPGERRQRQRRRLLISLSLYGI